MPPRKKIDNAPEEGEEPEGWTPEDDEAVEAEASEETDEDYVPPSKRTAMRKAEELVRRALGAEEPDDDVDQAPRQRSVTAHAKWSVSRKLNDANQTLDSRAYEVIITEQGEMSFMEVQRVSRLLNNEATLQVAAYLDLPTIEDDSGRVVFGEVPVSKKVATERTAAPAAKKRYSEDDEEDERPVRRAPAARPAPNNRPRGGGAGRSAAYSPEQRDELWGLWQENEEDFWDNLTGDWPNVKPKNNLFDEWAAEQNAPPPEPKPLYAKNAPPKIKRILQSRGVDV